MQVNRAALVKRTDFQSSRDNAVPALLVFSVAKDFIKTQQDLAFTAIVVRIRTSVGIAFKNCVGRQRPNFGINCFFVASDSLLELNSLGLNRRLDFLRWLLLHNGPHR